MGQKHVRKREGKTTCEPISGADLAQQLHAAVRNIDGEYKRIEISETDINEGRTIPADPDVRNFSYALVNGQVYYRENSVMTRPCTQSDDAGAHQGMIELRDCVRKLIDLQLTDGSDAEIRHSRQNWVGCMMRSAPNTGSSTAKPTGGRLKAILHTICFARLKYWMKTGKLKRKADIFGKRTIRRRAGYAGGFGE